MKKSELAAFALAVVALASAQSKRPSQTDDGGVLTLDESGEGTKSFPAGYLDTHFCQVSDGFDGVAVGFTTRYFRITDGEPKQEVPWGCVPLDRVTR